MEKTNSWGTIRRQWFFNVVARVPVSLGGRGVWLCSPSSAFAAATVRNRRQPSATVRNGLHVRHSSPQWRARLEWSRKGVKLTSGRRSYSILVFAEKVSV